MDTLYGIDIEEEFLCIFYCSYTDLELTRLIGLSLLADRIL